MTAETNRALIGAFAAQFDPPLTVVPTARIDDTPVSHAYAASYFDAGRNIGITAVVFGSGAFKAYIEATPRGGMEEVERVGELFAGTLGIKPGDDGSSLVQWGA